MKTKSFLLLCFFLGFGITQLSAQNSNSTGTFTIQGRWTTAYWSPVYCGDTEVDILEGGEIIIHAVVHRKDGKRVWRIDQIRGEVTSAKVPFEVFKIEELDKYDFIDNTFSTLTWKYNLLGDKGTRYIGTLIQDLATGDITIGKTLCK